MADGICSVKAPNIRYPSDAFPTRDGQIIVADDSGLEVDALGGAPGVQSARYAGTHGDDAANRARLKDALAAVENAFTRLALGEAPRRPAA